MVEKDELAEIQQEFMKIQILKNRYAAQQSGNHAWQNNFKAIMSVGDVIYESDDAGKTVYARRVNYAKRYLVPDLDAELKSTESVIDRADRRAKTLATAIELADQYPALGNLLDQLELVHTLVASKG